MTQRYKESAEGQDADRKEVSLSDFGVKE